MTMTEAELQQVVESNGIPNGSEVEAVQKSIKNLSLENLDNTEAEKSESEPIPESNSQEESQDSEASENGEQDESNVKTNSGKKDHHHQSRAERLEKQIELDSRSIFVGNITTEATAETLEEHFKDCGEVVRVTILYNKLTGAPKGYAYIEFESSDSIPKALELKDSELHGETINVAKKRTNVPGYNNNKNYYPRKEWVYPGWQGNVMRQWYYPYAAPGYQNYKPNGMPIPPPPQNTFYPQYPYVPRPTHNSGLKMGGYPRGNYRGNYRGNNFRGNYNGRRGNNHNGNYRGPRNQQNGNFNHADADTDVVADSDANATPEEKSSNSSSEGTTENEETQPLGEAETPVTPSKD